MTRDAQRIDHMLDFVRRSLSIIDGVDEVAYKAALTFQPRFETLLASTFGAAAPTTNGV